MARQSTAERRTTPHNRISNSGSDGGATHAHGQAADAGRTKKINSLIRRREAVRKIKLKERSPEQFEVHSLNDAPVLTGNEEPDMRLATNKNLFSPDPSKTVTGKEDRRFLENRDDLLEYHAMQGDDRPNVIFREDQE